MLKSMCEKLALDRAARFPLFTILPSPLLRSCFVRHFNYIIRQLAITHCRKPKIISIFLVYLSSYFLCLFLSPNTQHTNSSAPHNFPACFFADLNSDLQKLSYAGPRARTAWKTNHQTVFYICNLFSRLRNSFSFFFLFTNPQFLSQNRVIRISDIFSLFFRNLSIK